MSADETKLERDTAALRADIEQLRTDLSSVTRTLKEMAADVGSQAFERAKAKTAQARDEAKRAGDAVTHQIEEKPLLSVIIAFLVGLALAGLIRRQR